MWDGVGEDDDGVEERFCLIIRPNWDGDGAWGLLVTGMQLVLMHDFDGV